MAFTTIFGSGDFEKDIHTYILYLVNDGNIRFDQIWYLRTEAIWFCALKRLKVYSCALQF